MIQEFQPTPRWISRAIDFHDSRMENTNINIKQEARKQEQNAMRKGRSKKQEEKEKKEKKEKKKMQIPTQSKHST